MRQLQAGCCKVVMTETGLFSENKDNGADRAGMPICQLLQEGGGGDSGEVKTSPWTDWLLTRVRV